MCVNALSYYNDMYVLFYGCRVLVWQYSCTKVGSESWPLFLLVFQFPSPWRQTGGGATTPSPGSRLAALLAVSSTIQRR